MALLAEWVNRWEGTYTLRIIVAFGQILVELLPFLLIGVLISATLNYGAARLKFVVKPFRETLAIVSAALIGLISPLPTYLALPFGVSLQPFGMPRSAVFAFVIASPLINPSIFYLTWTQLGPEMAWARTGAAFTLAVVGGLCFKYLQLQWFNQPSTESGCRETFQLQQRPFGVELYRNLLYVGKYFSVAVLLSAAVKAMVPAAQVAAWLGGNIHLSTLAALALGVPLYSCGGAAIPLIQTLQEMGMNPGAALAFFLAGPATKLETIYVYQRLLGNRITLFYLLLTVAGAWLCGNFYQLVVG